MREMKDRYVLEGELPGVEKKDIDIEFTDNNTLSVSGHTEQATSTEGPEHSWWYSERSTGDFRRSFNFPAPVDHDHVEASLNNGVLSISLPKAQAESTGKRIDIK
jgi:HSP20 family protein